MGEEMTAKQLSSIRELIAEGQKVGLTPAEIKTLSHFEFFGKLMARTANTALNEAKGGGW